jgi:hypothetical protein
MPRAAARYPKTQAAAIATATELIERQGRSVDLGLMQVNSANLRPLGLTVADAFDPCRNMAAGARILQEGYSSARRAVTELQTAFRVAFPPLQHRSPYPRFLKRVCRSRSRRRRSRRSRNSFAPANSDPAAAERCPTSQPARRRSRNAARSSMAAPPAIRAMQSASVSASASRRSFGWIKAASGMRKTRVRPVLARGGCMITLTAATCNLVRLSKLLANAACRRR